MKLAIFSKTLESEGFANDYVRKKINGTLVNTVETK